MARAGASATRIELRRYTLPRPSEMWEVDDAPILSVVLPRAEGSHGDIMYDAGDRNRYRVGRVMLRPAGIAMHSRGDGGIMDILTCRFDPERFEAATGLNDWDTQRLRLCAAIETPHVRSLAARLRREATEPGFASSLAVDALTDLLMVDLGRLLRGAHRGAAARGGLAPWQLARIEEALRASVGTWPSTQTLATLCGVSRSHLSRSYALATGKALSDHAAYIRIERAQDMIRAGDLPLGSIAHVLGFATASAFSAAFRRATGLTPRQFRQRQH
nr:AraC family transcriptional regulator [Sphingobium sp. OAS761]